MGKIKSKILIVEDEPIIASDIEMTLEELGYEITSVEDNAEDALKSIEENKPDLVMLDINLEGDIDGVMLAQDINEQHKIPFVYLTSNADKLTINRVKRTNPAGFVLKPFSEKDLQSNIEIALYSSNNTVVENDETTTEFFVKDAGGLVKVKVEDILFVQADDNYSRIFTINKNHLISSTLKKVDDKLPKTNFVRIHRSYIVNVNFIDKLKDGYLYLGKHQLPIGRSYQEALNNRITKL